MDNKIYIKSMEIPNQNYSGNRAFIEYEYDSNLASKGDIYIYISTTATNYSYDTDNN